MAWSIFRPTPPAKQPDHDVRMLLDALDLMLDDWAARNPGQQRRIDRAKGRIARLPVPTGLLRELRAIRPPLERESLAPAVRRTGVDPELAGDVAHALVELAAGGALPDPRVERALAELARTVPRRIGNADARSLAASAQRTQQTVQPLRRRALAAQHALEKLVAELRQELGAADGSGARMEQGLARLVAGADLQEELVEGISVLRRDMSALRTQLRAATQRAAGLESLVAAQAARIVDLRAEVNLDALTQVANRRAFDAWLAAAVPRCLASGRALALALFDVDHFKSINDTFGHPVGDQALQALAKRFADSIRANDEVARVGGEEFAVILHDAPPAVAHVVAERLRSGVALTLNTSRGPVLVRVSGGVACLISDDTPQTLYERADKALFQAKELGRDRMAYG